MKNIAKIIDPPAVRFVGDGFRVHNFIPGVEELSMKRMDPFILLDYGSKFYFSPSQKQRGVGIHPHRGFETVTIAYKGKVAHKDSAGNSGVIEEGDVQWMTAASGILHEEFHEKEFSQKGGDFHVAQLWINLPAKDKKSLPKYQAIKSDQMGKYQIESGQGIVEVIAGEYKGVKGPASTFTRINLFNLRSKKGTTTDFSFPKEFNTSLLVVEGSVEVNNKEIKQDHFVLMANDGETFTIETLEDSIVLIMSGEPINEPIAASGPFVMNTKEEIYEAYDDFQNGRF